MSILAIVCLAIAACSNAARQQTNAVPSSAAPSTTPTGAIYTSRHAAPAAQLTAAALRTPARRPQIVTPPYPLQCVPFARALSDIKIRGDAWTWWKQARGRYTRNRMPAVGSVLVLKSRGGSRGHVAVVTRILNDREIVVDHANWLNHGRIHLDTPVKDVSRGNDWSTVRVWYTPGQIYGAGVYPAHGFIHPVVTTASR